MGFEVALLTVLLALGVPANAALLAVLWRHKDMHTTPNIFIANLAAADLMNILVYAPLSVLNYVRYDESYGDIICKCIMSACDLFMIVSVYTFICMSAYRYMGIRSLVARGGEHPRLTRRGAVATVALVWALAAALSVHSALDAGLVASHCFFRLSRGGYALRRSAEILLVFALPFAAIAYLCAATSVLLRRSAASIPGEHQGAAIAARRRSANVPITLILQFFACHVFRLGFLVADLWARHSRYSAVDHGLFCFLLLYFVFSAFLTYLHSCLPPVMLLFTSSSIRGHFLAGLGWRAKKGA
ncbi:neuropeptide CCHamide-1 receptor-like [Bacillus rossius redtenbacheri]|uniref:neuropeptide CCHamide-1 receptor-like n=1 Tax=Bacillus rossius redtenbacheri TaxID=93214 RepID=UPI002FDE75AB